MQPALAAGDGRLVAGSRVPRREDALLASALVTLRAQLGEHDPGRVGICASTTCADVFVDASPAGHRRFCSVTCQNRERVAAFRRRRVSSP